MTDRFHFQVQVIETRQHVHRKNKPSPIRGQIGIRNSMFYIYLYRKQNKIKKTIFENIIQKLGIKLKIISLCYEYIFQK